MKTKKLRTLAQQAYQAVRDKMLRGDLPFGTPLSRRSLAVELGMSMVPVTEALQRLENDGLVESWPRVGTRVKVPTAHDIRDFVIVREALESQAARLFAERASLAERRQLIQMSRELDRLFRRLSRLPQKESSYQFHLKHTEFHLRIAEWGGCLGLCRALEKNQILVLHWLYDTSLGEGCPQPETWHEDLARILCEGNPIKADETMRHHVRLGLEDSLRAVEPYHRMRQYPLRNPYTLGKRNTNREIVGPACSDSRSLPRSAARKK